MLSKNFEIEPYSDDFAEVKVVRYNKKEDLRGLFVKVFTSEDFKEEIGNLDEVYYSISDKNVIRGIHLQSKPFGLIKLVTCVDGRVNDFFIDLRSSSNNYKKFGSIELDNETAIVIPYGYGHGFSVLSEKAIVMYCQNGSFNEENEFGVNPLSVNFDWGVSNPILSERDNNLPHINESEFTI